MNRLILLPMLLTLSAGAAEIAPIGKNITVYHVGNSLTRGLSLGTGGANVDRVDPLFESVGGNYRYGSQLAAGARLDQHYYLSLGSYNNLRSSDGAALAGNYNTVLQSQSLHALILQPHQQHIGTAPTGSVPEGDRYAIRNFINYAMGGNPASFHSTGVFYIYQTWPNQTGLDSASTFEEYWLRPYNPSGSVSLNTPSRSQSYQLITHARADSPAAAIGMIPVGDVLLELDRKIRAGTLSGYETYFNRFETWRALHESGYTPATYNAAEGVKQFWVDNIHFNLVPHNNTTSGTIGAYVAALTLFATLTGESPVGLTAAPYGHFNLTEDAALITSLQQTVWDVVAGHPFTGVPAIPEPSSAALLASAAVGFLIWRRRQRPSPLPPAQPSPTPHLNDASAQAKSLASASPKIPSAPAAPSRRPVRRRAKPAAV